MSDLDTHGSIILLSAYPQFKKKAQLSLSEETRLFQKHPLMLFEPCFGGTEHGHGAAFTFIAKYDSTSVCPGRKWQRNTDFISLGKAPQNLSPK